MMDVEAGGISDRKCAAFADEGAAAAGVAMVTLACWDWRSSEYPEVAMTTTTLSYFCGWNKDWTIHENIFLLF